MRFWLILFVFSIASAKAVAQDSDGDDKPRIRHQLPDPIRISEDTPFIVGFNNLVVRDRDDWFYPWGFTMKLYPGEHYTIDGTKVIPEANYNGQLKVPVTVNDGEQDSDPFDLKFEVEPVNDAPVIESQATLTVNSGESITLTTANLVIRDPDDTQFTLTVSQGSNYTVSGTTVTPTNGFTGTLSVPVRVNDGDANSEVFNVQITVVPSAPSITGQIPLTALEDESIQLKLSDITVNDPRNQFPNGFTLILLEGLHYTFANTTVTPERDFTGNLSVNVMVSDGQRNSETYPLMIVIKPINDAATFINLEEEPIVFEPGEGPLQISKTIEAYDPDTDSLTQVEITFDLPTYRYGIDKLAIETSQRISGSFNADQGKILLTGIAAIEAYTDVVRSLHYETLLNDEPLTETKKILIRADDGRGFGDFVYREIKPYSIAINLDIPSAFTPNGDQSNDTWVIKALKHSEEYTRAVVRIYNRSGKLLFEGIGISTEWDGTSGGQLLPSDSYFYTIDLGTQFLDSSLRGIVTILR
jgi:gliding motility-associated-like protein